MLKPTIALALLAVLFSSQVVSASAEKIFSEKVGPTAKQYYGVTQFMNFNGFVDYCRRNNMQPAEVHSKAENDALTNYVNANFPDPKYFWLGGKDDVTEGRYYWVTSQAQFNFTSWGPGYPNGGTAENCATVYGGDGSWYDQYCDNDQIWPLCETVTL